MGIAALTAAVTIAWLSVAPSAHAAAGVTKLRLAGAKSGSTASSVSLSVAGSGAVTVNGLTCAAQCTIPQGAGQLTTLTAVPASGSSFSGWSGGCTGVAPVCALYPNGATSLTATFTPQPTALLATVSGPGVVTSGYTLLPIAIPIHRPGLPAFSPAVSCGTTAAQLLLDQCSVTSFTTGEQVLLTATADPGAVFAGWGGACAQYVTAACYVEAGPIVGVTATFQLATPATTKPSLNVDDQATSLLSGPASALAGCTEGHDCLASTSPDETVTLAAGAPFEIGAASPNAPSIVWSGDCVGNWPVCSLVVDAADLTTQALEQVPVHFFYVNGYPVGLTVSGKGTISLKGSSSHPCASGNSGNCTLIEPPNMQVTLIAKGSKDWKFRSWQVDSQGCSGTKATCTFTTGAGQNEIGVFSKKK